MIIGILVISMILVLVFLMIGACSESIGSLILSGIFVIVAAIVGIFGCFHGFINHKPTSGVHQGVLTAIDLEGTYFRRYEVYLKSSGYTDQGDETVYLLYDYETDLAEQLQESVGKTVKLEYGFEGGYIPWNSCGTYHITGFEVVEEEQQ